MRVAIAQNPKSILITGGSSGIGEALAKLYARKGVHLALGGRDKARLRRVAESCRALGARVNDFPADVLDRKRMADWIAEADEVAPLDLVIANAGISGGTGRGTEPGEQRERILSVNVDGVFNTVGPAIERMRARGHGQVAIMASLAAFRGFPGAPAYCASKACVRVWGESMRGHLAAEGVGVSVICPGYVRSRMTADNKFRMPFLMDADAAAQVIRKGLSRNRARIAFPWPLTWGVWLLSALPPGLTDPMMRRLPTKV
jgi:short-subunit dehydrogenase